MSVILVRKEFVGDATFDKLKLWVIPVTTKFEERSHIFNLLVDTGAQRTVINTAVSEILGLKVGSESVEGIGVTGKDRYFSAKLNLEIGSISFLDQNVLVGSSLPGIYNRYEISGILGADVLQLLYLKIDYPKKLLEIERLTTYY